MSKKMLENFLFKLITLTNIDDNINVCNPLYYTLYSVKYPGSYYNKNTKNSANIRYYYQFNKKSYFIFIKRSRFHFVC